MILKNTAGKSRFSRACQNLSEVCFWSYLARIICEKNTDVQAKRSLHSLKSPSHSSTLMFLELKYPIIFVVHHLNHLRRVIILPAAWSRNTVRYFRSSFISAGFPRSGAPKAESCRVARLWYLLAFTIIVEKPFTTPNILTQAK